MPAPHLILLQSQINKFLKIVMRFYLLCLLPIVLLLFYWTNRPFADVLSSHTISMAGLSKSQRLNIRLAARQLNGVVLRPKEQFSFNRVVGPRTSERGYLAAPSYLGGETLSSAGGGICLLSSCLYQAALQAGLTITERHAHLRTIHSVPPGLDATVWYGTDDLKFANNLLQPIQIHAQPDLRQIRMEILGTKSANYMKQPPLELIRQETMHSKEEVLVEVISKKGNNETIISRDLYQITR